MIKKIIIILSTLLLFACASQQTVTEPITQPEGISPPAEKIPEVAPKEAPPMTRQQKCILAASVAQSNTRRVLDRNDQYIGDLHLPGECGEGFCVLSETVDQCGWIVQKIDFDGDDVPDQDITWKPIINIDTKEVFFRLFETKESEESIFTL